VPACSFVPSFGGRRIYPLQRDRRRRGDVERIHSCAQRDRPPRVAALDELRGQALALGAQGIHCGTAFLATEESFAHDFHKRRVVEAASDETVYSDVFAINWPPRSPVRTLRNSVTEAYADNLLGHGPDEFPREAIAEEEGRPVYRFSTDSPLRNMTGDFEPLAPFAGQICGLIESVRPAGEVVRAMAAEAEAVLARLREPVGAAG